MSIGCNTSNESRRQFLSASIAAVATAAIAAPFGMVSRAATTATDTSDQSQNTTGVGPEIFFRDRLGMEFRAGSDALAARATEAVRQLTAIGYAKRLGRWDVVRSEAPSETVGVLIAAQFGKGPVPIGDSRRVNLVEQYNDYDLSEPTVAAFVTMETDDDHVAILRHRHWDALHLFAPIAPKDELARMLLPVRSKRPIHSWERAQLFERGIVEYFSALGEVNIQAERAFRRLRLKNIHGQSIYDKHNA